MGILPEGALMDLSEYDGFTRKELYAEIASLKQKIADAQKDAYRYRFLRSASNEDGIRITNTSLMHHDAAIDDAITQKESL